MHTMMNTPIKTQKGFTLIEMMVSVALFAIIMAIGAGAILSIINGNRKAEALSSVVNNLNFAVESMTRDMKTGNNYQCGNASDPDFPNCPTGENNITFSSILNAGNVVYCLVGNHISRSIATPPSEPSCGDSNSENISSDEVNITNLEFYVSGATVGPSDGQPKVLIIIQGTAGTGKTASPFNIETMVSQRSLDI